MKTDKSQASGTAPAKLCSGYKQVAPNMGDFIETLSRELLAQAAFLKAREPLYERTLALLDRTHPHPRRLFVERPAIRAFAEAFEAG